MYIQPITSDACSVLYRWNIGIVGLKSGRAREMCVSSVHCVACGFAAGRNPVQGVLPDMLQDSESRNPGHISLHCHTLLLLLLLLLLLNIPSWCECSASLLGLVEELFNTKC